MAFVQRPTAPLNFHEKEKQSYFDTSINPLDDDFPTAAMRRQKMEDSISRIVSNAVHGIFAELERVPWTHTRADFLLCWDGTSFDSQHLHALWIAPSDVFYEIEEAGKVGHNAIVRKNLLVGINDEVELVADLKDSLRQRILRKLWVKGYKASFGTVLFEDCQGTGLVPYITVAW